MAHVFITGGAGFVGHHAARQLVRSGHEVTSYDAFLNYIDPVRSHYGDYLKLRLDEQDPAVKSVRGDVRSTSGLTAALREAEPDVVVHLAAIPLATASNRFSEEAIQINLNGTVSMLEAVRSTPSVRRVVFVSSSFVYGDFHYDPADEAHPTDPIDVYGAGKLAGEALTKGFGRRFGVEFTIVRLSAVYGPTDANRRVTQIFVERAVRGEPLILHDGGRSRVDFTYCEDAASGVVAAALEPGGANEVFNITRGKGRSIKELATILGDLVPGTVTEERAPEERRPERGGLSIEKAQRLLGYAPRWDLEDGMREYVAFVRACGLVVPAQVAAG